MGFVKAVAGKLLHQVEDIGGEILTESLLLGALQEQVPLLGHLLGLLFTHGTTQQVRTTQCKATHLLGDLHHLLLVENNAVGGLQGRLKAVVLVFGMGVADLGTALLAVDKVIHHSRLQRAGTEQGHQCHNILKAVRTQLADQLFHTAGFQLEYRGGFTPLHQLVCGLIVQRNMINIEQLFATGLALLINHAHRPVDNGQGAQAEEVKLDQAGIFHIVLVKLGYHTATGLIAVDR